MLPCLLDILITLKYLPTTTICLLHSELGNPPGFAQEIGTALKERERGGRRLEATAHCRLLRGCPILYAQVVDRPVQGHRFLSRE